MCESGRGGEEAIGCWGWGEGDGRGVGGEDSEFDVCCYVGSGRSASGLAVGGEKGEGERAFGMGELDGYAVFIAFDIEVVGILAGMFAMNGRLQSLWAKPSSNSTSLAK